MKSRPRTPLSLRTVDLFAGCGGLSLGFQKAGFDLVAAYDNWGLALETYRANFDHEAHHLDLGKVDAAAKHISNYTPDVIIGGPPCQDFSIAGKRVESSRASLTVAFAEIVTRVSPRLVVMENVYSIEGSRALTKARTILTRSGYGLTSRIIDASRAGVPQMRRRFFLVGALGFEDDAFGVRLDGNLTKTRMTVADYFRGSLGVNHYYAHPRTYKRRAIFSIHEPSATIRRVNRPIPRNYERHPADKVAPSSAVRPLTFEERSQLQTFPRSFEFRGSRSQQEHLMANAVPVNLAKYVAEQVIAVLSAKDRGLSISPQRSVRVG